jgi:hypothetical protein
MTRFVLPALLPILVTAVTLASAAWNRSAGRGPTMLTERELVRQSASDDNSGQSVWLQHQYAWGDEMAWLNAEKLASLGFDTSVDPRSPDAGPHYRRALRRVAYLALELDGPAWQAWASEYERNLRQWTPDADPKKQVADSSRLVPVDASLDAATLEARYPNPRTHLITRGAVRILVHTLKDAPARLSGSVDLAPDSLYVPPDVARQLRSPRYRLSVRYGRRYEPWIAGVEP